MARILVVDDEPDLLTVCQLVLESAGHDVTTCLAGASTVRLAQSFHPDLILIDLLLADTTGDRVLRALRREPETAAVAVVIMSALPEASVRIRTVGADGFIGKPFDADELLDQLDRLPGVRTHSNGACPSVPAR